MSTLFLIRHAESEANKKRILASRLPFPLTSAGKADADLIASELKELTQIGRIITSPLVRAKETADSFKKQYSIEPEIDDRISEQELGIFSGMTYDEVMTHSKYESDSQNRWNWIPEGGGESYSIIADRVTEFFSSLEKNPADENILIVTHAVTFRLIKAILENTLPEYPTSFPNNGEIWKVRFKRLGHKHEIESIFLGNSKDFAHNP
ncbi:MAG: histidine phosphatase family protein [Deltaproteobacteria bacterium]|nr:histidine phosphatase family protein [Deltaproteobacteria bacterium]